jgi:hypothetical protein
VSRDFYQREIPLLMGVSGLLFQFFAPCLHLQFIQWTEFLIPFLILSCRRKVIIYLIYELCWC